MRSVLKINPWFFIPFALFVLVGGIAIYLNPKPELHKFFNQYHSTSADSFFKIITHGGGGALIGSILLIFIILNYKKAIVLAIAFLLTLGVVNLYKQVIYPKMERPVKYFEDRSLEIRKVPNYSNHSFKSFPSGHSAEVFCTLSFAALMLRRKIWGIGLFVLASLVAYSRVYLSQHFFIDIYTGALVAVFMVIIGIWIGQRLKLIKMEENQFS